MDLGPALQVMIQFVVIATIITFAYDTLKAVVASPGWDDNIRAIIGVVICFVWKLDLITVCAGNATVYAVGPYLGMAISGIAMAGGPVKLLMQIRSKVKGLQDAAS